MKDRDKWWNAGRNRKKEEQREDVEYRKKTKHKEGNRMQEEIGRRTERRGR
jgi:hypothetical protein